MEASREFLRRLPPCSEVSVFEKTRMSRFRDTHHRVEAAANTTAPRQRPQSGRVTSGLAARERSVVTGSPPSPPDVFRRLASLLLVALAPFSFVCYCFSVLLSL